MSQSMKLVALVFLAAFCGSLSAEQEGGALQKVIHLLSDFLAKTKAAKADEEISSAEFQQWCVGQKASLKKNIKLEGEKADALEGEKLKKQSDIKELGKQFTATQNSIAKFEAELKAEKTQRKKDHAEFQVEARDFEESIDAIERATETMNKQSGDIAGSAVLLQLSSSTQLPQKAKSMITAFAAMMDADYEADGKGAPKANAYEFQGGGVIDMLKKLRDDFDKQLTDAQKEEMNGKHASDMVVANLEDSIENAKQAAEETTLEKATKAQELALSQKEFNKASSEKKEDQSTLTDVEDECFQKKQAYAGKQQMRGEEIEALQKAIEILSDPEKMSGASLLDLAHPSKAAAVLTQFLGASTSDASGVRHKMRRFVEQRARALGSRKLAMLAEKLEVSDATADPFAKIKTMIEGMISHITKEASADAEHEGFCDKEVAKSKQTRTKLTEQIDSLNARVSESKAEIMQLTQDSGTLSNELTALDTSMSEAAELRTKEKAKNKQVIKDAKAALKSVQAAVSVLRDFYATAFLQVEQRHDNKEAMGGVMALLEVISEDFSRLRADTEASEGAAHKSYKNFMSEASRNKAVKSTAMDHAQSDKVDAEGRMNHDQGDLKDVHDQLAAADTYHATLVPQCMNPGQTYEEKKEAREAEIESMKQALDMLEQ